MLLDAFGRTLAVGDRILTSAATNKTLRAGIILSIDEEPWTRLNYTTREQETIGTRYKIVIKYLRLRYRNDDTPRPTRKQTLKFNSYNVQPHYSSLVTLNANSLIYIESLVDQMVVR